MEFWKEIGVMPNYEISNLGRVKSKGRVVARSNGSKMTIRERIIKTYINHNGYEVAVIQDGKKGKHFQVHRLVAEAFIDNNEDKPFVNHIDGVKTNNLISNLEWVTKSENEIHAYSTGLKSLKGESHSQNKLTKSKVIEIRDNNHNLTHQALANKYNVSRSCITGIMNNRTWKHL